MRVWVRSSRQGQRVHLVIAVLSDALITHPHHAVVCEEGLWFANRKDGGNIDVVRINSGERRYVSVVVNAW